MAAQSSASVMTDRETDFRGTEVCWIWRARVASMSATRPADTATTEPSSAVMSRASWL
jgi:hypothetical protein